jgi:alanine-glyoxylate transaminase / serine-glyoxylate transaminase / serine-pyruvate transaminase
MAYDDTLIEVDTNGVIVRITVPKNILALDTILPDEPLLMMGAGPVPIPAKVAAANGIVINHLGDTMAQIIEQVKVMSRYVFQTESGRILGVAGPGSAAMEMAVVNLVVPGSKVLSVCNGFFSNRLAQMAQRVGADVVQLAIEDGKGANVELVAQYIVQHQPQVLTIVQGETSNTVFNSELAAISAVAKQHNCLVIVDAVCTLSTMAFDMDEWGIDAVITGGQKGLSCIPGISLVGFSAKAWQHIEERKDQLKHWCLDAKLADQFWYKKSYHYTAPVSGILAIHEALRLVCSETLSVRFDRHLRCSEALQAGIEGMGLSLYVKPESRLNSVVGITMPQGIESKILLSTMSKRFKVEISGSFGPNIVRIGQMGEQCRAHNLFRTLHAFGASFNILGQKLDLPAGMAALEGALNKYQFSEGL